MGFDPYEQWLDVPPIRRPPSHYDLLGLRPDETDRDRIELSHAQRYEHVRKYVLGPEGELAHRILAELSRAVTCLADSDKREAYATERLGQSIQRWLTAEREPADFYELLDQQPFTPTRDHLLWAIRTAGQILDQRDGDRGLLTTARSDPIHRVEAPVATDGPRECGHYEHPTNGRDDDDAKERVRRLRQQLDAAEIALCDPEAYRDYHRPILVRLHEEYARDHGDDRNRWDIDLLEQWLGQEQWVHPGRVEAVVRALCELEPDARDSLLEGLFPVGRAAEGPRQQPPVGTAPEPGEAGLEPAPRGQTPPPLPDVPPGAGREGPVGALLGTPVPWYVSCPLIAAVLVIVPLSTWALMSPGQMDGQESDPQSAMRPLETAVGAGTVLGKPSVPSIAAADTPLNSEPPFAVPPERPETVSEPAPVIAQPPRPRVEVAEGELTKLIVYQGEVHLLIRAAEPGGDAGTVEAFAAADFADQLADYRSGTEWEVADRVAIEGSECPSGGARFRLDGGAPLVALRQIRRAGDPDSLAVVGEGPRERPDPDLDLTGLARFLRYRPAVGAELECTCHVTDYSFAEETLYVSPCLSGRPLVAVRLISAGPSAILARGREEGINIYVRRPADESWGHLYERGEPARLNARVVRSDHRELVLEAIDIRPTTGPGAEIAANDSEKPDLTKEKRLWRTICHNPQPHVGATLNMAGTFTRHSPTRTDACVVVDKLFFKDERVTVSYLMSGRASDFLGALQPGEEILFAVRIVEVRSAFDADQPATTLVWLSRLSEPEVRLVFPARVKGRPAKPSAVVELPKSSPNHVYQINAHNGKVNAVAFSPDGQILATGGADGALRIWDAREGKARHGLTGHSGPITAMAWHPQTAGGEEMLIATGSSDETIKVWDLAAPPQNAPGNNIDALSEVCCLSWRYNGTRLAAGLRTGELLICDPRPRRPPSAQRKRLSSLGISSLAWHPTRSRHGYVATGDALGVVWVVDPGRPLPICGCAPGPLSAMSTLAQISPRLRNSRALKNIKIGQRSPGCCHHLAWSPDGSRLAVVGADIEVWDFDPASGLTRSPISWDGWYSPGEYRTAAWHPDGKVLAAGGEDKLVSMWHVPFGDQTPLLRSPDEVTSLAFSPDGFRLAVACADGTVTVWNVP